MNIKGCINAGLYLVEKNMPAILGWVGAVGSVTATVWACKQTLNLPDIMEENDDEMIEIENSDVDEKTKSQMKRGLFIRTTCKIVKNYWKPAVVEIVSIAASGKAIYIYKERTVEAATVAAGAIQGFREYRDRVKDRWGEAAEKEVYYGMKKGEVEETITDEKGKEKTVKKKVNVVDPNISGEYFRRYLTRKNQKIWHGGDRLYIENDLNMAQNVLTDKLHADSFNTLTINEVFEYLGFDKCREGMTYGWLYDYNNPDRQNNVTITWEEVYIPGDRGTLEKAYALDFNIDGNIYELTAGEKGSK